MSRTERADLKRQRGPASVWMRKPKGAKQAKATAARSVPPTSWDDLNIGREAVRQAERKG